MVAGRVSVFMCEVCVCWGNGGGERVESSRERGCVHVCVLTCHDYASAIACVLCMPTCSITYALGCQRVTHTDPPLQLYPLVSVRKVKMYSVRM
eukprot:37661-Eustigmatos_ZCMA.PRE.1